MYKYLILLTTFTTMTFAHEGAKLGHTHAVTGSPSYLWLQEGLSIDGETYQKLNTEIASWMEVKKVCPIKALKMSIVEELTKESPDMKTIKKTQKEMSKTVLEMNPQFVEHLLRVKTILGNEKFVAYTKVMKKVYQPVIKETAHSHTHTHPQGTHSHPHQHEGDIEIHEHEHATVDHSHEHMHDDGTVHSHHHHHMGNVENHHHKHDTK